MPPRQNSKLGQTSKPDPYFEFRDDHERRLALRSRDVRLSIIALALLFGPHLGGVGAIILRWL